METVNKDAIEAAGFKVRSDGKIMDGGKLVSQAVADRIIGGTIITGFDMAAMRAKRARASATGTADLVASLKKITPDIELLKVGQTAKIAMPKTAEDGKSPKRSFVMSIVTKLNNLTALGREWAGRSFDSLADDEGNYFYVTRLPDGEAKERKKGGGRKAQSSKDNLANALEAAKGHLGGKDGNEEPVEDTVIHTGGGESTVEPMEDATVIQH